MWKISVNINLLLLLIINFIQVRLAVPVKENVNFPSITDLFQVYPSDIEFQMVRRILQGNDAVPGEFKSTVSIQSRPKFKHVCGGVLLTYKKVLTAAHCIPYRAIFYRVQAGSLLLGAGGQFRYVDGVFRHPHWNSRTLVNDIGVLTLTSDFDEDPLILPASIRYTEIPSSSVCSVSGWGVQQGYTKALQRTDMLIEDLRFCRQVYGRFLPIRRSVICTTGLLGSTLCHGDSGGALLCNGNITGIVSFGDRDCLPGTFVVFSNVSRYSNWIQHNLTNRINPSVFILLISNQFLYFLFTQNVYL